jgi:hypothetical protein
MAADDQGKAEGDMALATAQQALQLAHQANQNAKAANNKANQMFQESFAQISLNSGGACNLRRIAAQGTCC